MVHPLQRYSIAKAISFSSLSEVAESQAADLSATRTGWA